jgi:hypothetical protein
VLHDGAWVAGWLTAYRRDGDRWRGFVRYSTAPGAGYVQWGPDGQLRPPVLESSELLPGKGTR